jgi:hypothetical protein
MTMGTESTLNSAFLFSVQRALPEDLPQEFSGISLDADEKTLYIRCHIDGPVTAAGREFMAYLKNAILADFFPAVWVEVAPVLTGMVQGGTWVYRRSRVLAHA